MSALKIELKIPEDDYDQCSPENSWVRQHNYKFQPAGAKDKGL